MTREEAVKLANELAFNNDQLTAVGKRIFINGFMECYDKLIKEKNSILTLF